MNLLRSFPLLAFALVMLSIIGFCIAQPNPSIGLLVVAGTLGALSWYVTEGPRGRSLPRWVSNLLTAAVAIGVVGDLLENLGPHGDIMGVLGRFTVWLTLIKLYERKAPRDYAQLLALSMLLMLVGCLQSVKLVFGGVLLLYAVLGLHVLLQFQLHVSFERARTRRAASIPAGFRLAPAVQPIFGRHVGLQLRGLLSGIVIVGMALSSVVFVLSPRSGGRATWGNPAAGPEEPESDFSEEINLTTGTRITTSQRVVATLRLLDPNSHPIRLERPLLLRGAVLSDYIGRGRWRATRDDSLRPSVIVTQPGRYLPLVPISSTTTEQLERQSDRLLTQEFTLMPRERAMLTRQVFSLDVPLRMTSEFSARFRIDPATQSIESAGETWLRSYKVQAMPDADDRTVQMLWGDRVSETPVQRFNRPEVRELAEQLLTRAGLPTSEPQHQARSDSEPADERRWEWRSQAADAFRRFLQSSRFTYDTDLSDVAPASPSSDGDPISRFLQETRRGHCEYFASAMTALCHSVGIPARLVTGYAAQEYDTDEQRYIIRESSAHAWTEALIGPDRWTTIDATPPGTLGSVRRTASSVTDWLRNLYGSFELSWLTHVVFFDAKSQSQLVGQVSSTWSSRLSATMADVLDWMRLVNSRFGLGPTGYLWLGLVAFAAVLAVVATIKVWRRLTRLRVLVRSADLGRGEVQRLLRQLGFYLDMLRVLDRGGHAKPTWQPPLAYAHDLAMRKPALAEPVRELTELFYAARYGRLPLDHDRLARARSLLQQLAADLHVAV